MINGTDKPISRVEFFCDDRKVGDALRLLTGIAYGQPQVTPVVNAEKTGKGRNGKLVAKTNGTRVGMFAEWIKKKKLTEVTNKVAQEFLKSVGRNGGSAGASYLLTCAVAAGLLGKRTGASTASKYPVKAAALKG